MRVTDHDRDQIRAALQAISEQHHGILNPQVIVEVARDPMHILHPRFEWDDSLAGEGFRLAQAAALIRRVKFTVMRTDAVTRELTISTTRAYQSRPSMRTSAGGYERIDMLLSDATKRRELLAQVLAELGFYRKRYSELAELEVVWLAIDEAATDFRAEDSSATAPADEPRPGAAG